jgi:hypothetical protein
VRESTAACQQHGTRLTLVFPPLSFHLLVNLSICHQWYIHSPAPACLLVRPGGLVKKKERKKENGQVATKQQASASSVNCGDWRDVEGSCLSVPTASHAQSHEVLAGEGSCVRARRLVHRRRERNKRRRNEEPFFRPPHMGCLLLLATHQESHHERERAEQGRYAAGGCCASSFAAACELCAVPSEGRTRPLAS